VLGQRPVVTCRALGVSHSWYCKRKNGKMPPWAIVLSYLPLTGGANYADHPR
jgi:hypothetical protein